MGNNDRSERLITRFGHKDNIDERAQSLAGDEKAFNAVLDEFTTRIQYELHNWFILEFNK